MWMTANSTKEEIDNNNLMTRKILVVDDTRNVQVLLSDFLSSQDFEVLTASDGREAQHLKILAAQKVAQQHMHVS